jgi:hypothetical protein
MSTFRLRLPTRVLLPLFVALLTGSLTAALTGCTVFRSRLVTLCTNHPEMAAYVELFNALGPDVQVVLCYQPDPAARLASRDVKADVVIAEGLNGLSVKRQLEPLDRLFGDDGLRREEFYTGLLEAGLYERRQVTLPVSYRLPAVVFLSGTLGENLPNLSVSVEFLRGMSGEFRESVRDRYVRMGFSPLWDDRFLYESLRLQGAGFRESGEGGVQWEAQGLSEGISFLLSWIEQSDGGRAKTAEFSRKYLYEPMPKLVDEKRILFHLSDNGRLLEVLEAHADEADFRWLTGKNGILVDESVVSIGISRGSRNKWGARIFVDWLLDEATQKRLLEINHSKRLSTFGIADGFSSLRRVTEREFPKVYPLFIGRVPSAELLGFPAPLPVGWETTKREAVVPWARSFLGSGAPVEEASRALEAAIRTYRSERPAKL